MESNDPVDLKQLSSDEFLKFVEDASPQELILASSAATTKSTPKPNFITHLLAVEEGPRTFWDIVCWWEARRLAFNLIVGLSGLPALLYLSLHHGVTVAAWLAISAVSYGLAANVCYTAGAIAEYAAQRFFGEKAAHFGRICFALGTAFSVIITVLLGLIFSSTWMLFGTWNG